MSLHYFHIVEVHLDITWQKRKPKHEQFEVDLTQKKYSFQGTYPKEVY